ncbi:dehydrodolichyl diphosphate synthase 2 [Citrus sinensis]|nr:dehydrodolichyl diphosphate synthase 2 [Citrus sinensis]
MKWTFKRGWALKMKYQNTDSSPRRTCALLNYSNTPRLLVNSPHFVEVEFLMKLFEKSIKSELEGPYILKPALISMIADSSKLPKTLQELVSDAEDRTKNNSNFQLIAAVSYSGKYDVVQACKSIAQKVKDDVIRLDDIDESLIEQELETSCTDYPYPPYQLIRTSGELRVKFFFVQTLWPDFGKAEFVEALTSFQQRKRRGKNTSIAHGFSTNGKPTSMYKFNETLSPIFIPPVTRC